VHAAPIEVNLRAALAARRSMHSRHHDTLTTTTLRVLPADRASTPTHNGVLQRAIAAANRRLKNEVSMKFDR